MTEKAKSKAREYNRLLAQIDSVYHELALKQGFSDSAMSVLYVLADNGNSCMISDLVFRSGLSKQTVNSALRRLESDGIIFLQPEAGRTKRIRLTEKGEAVVRETAGRTIEIENSIYDSWTKDEWALYLELTERYLRDLREKLGKEI